MANNMTILATKKPPHLRRPKHKRTMLRTLRYKSNNKHKSDIPTPFFKDISDGVSDPV